MEGPTKFRDWRTAATLFAVTLLALAVAYRETLSSFLMVWRGSDTYGHGFLIVPICVTLVWRKRDLLSTLTPIATPAALLLLLPVGFAWLVGRVTNTLVVEQLSVVAMIPISVCAFFGLRVTRALAFPLGFLFFAVPFGSELQPWLRRVTADLAVSGLRATGIPVAREGLYLTTPVGEWRVADACSGLRFLVSGFALGCLFAHLMFQTARKRLLFGALSLLVPILANGLRAYVLILVGTTTDLRLGRGFDHYVVGWLAFSLVMAALFSVGFLYRDPPPPPTPAGHPREARGLAGSRRSVAWTAVAVLSLVVWPWLQATRYPESIDTGLPPIAAPRVPGWSEVPDSSSWKPAFSGASSECLASYVKDGARVRCYVASYVNQRQGRELIQSSNAIVNPDDPIWREMGERQRRIDGAGLLVHETDLRARDARALVWHWYWLPDEFTASPVRVKLLQARARLSLHRDPAAVIVLMAPVRADRNAAADLQTFLRDATPALRSSLQHIETP
ncbi:MAG: exosortase A [Candidatus Eiseniibacteriota bacterium]